MNEIFGEMPSLMKSSETNHLSSRFKSLSVKNDQLKKTANFPSIRTKILDGENLEMRLDPKTTAHNKRLIVRGETSPNHIFLKWLEHQDIYFSLRATPEEATTILNLRVDSL